MLKRPDLTRDISRTTVGYREDYSEGFVNSSIQRCRVIPKTYKKFDYSGIPCSKLTKPLPFSLSKSNYNKCKPKQASKPKQFKAKKGQKKKM